MDERPPDARTLGEIELESQAFDLDLKINEGYQAYSAELLRLSLLLLAGISAVWLKVYLPEKGSPTPHSNAVELSMAGAFVLLVLAAGSALLHRYAAADGLAYHLTGLRRLKRNRLAAREDCPSDRELAKGQFQKRDKRFKYSGLLLWLSVYFMIGGLISFGGALWAIMKQA